jgi:predicted permease
MTPIRLLRVAAARLRALVRRDAIAAEIREELEFHLNARIDQYERDGLTRTEAARKARFRVGNLLVLQDRGYDVRGGGLMETIVQDVRYGLRLLARQRGFSALAIATVAVGIGASTAIFSVIDAAILRPLPYPDPERLVEVTVRIPQRNGRVALLSPSLDDLRGWTDTGGVFESVAASQPLSFGRIVESPEPERVQAIGITDQYLNVFGVSPVLGRGFTRDDHAPGAPSVVMLGYGFWVSRFAGDRRAVGQAVRFEETPSTIVGVLPAGFHRDTAIWRPLQLQPGFERVRGTGIDVVGRLRRDVDPAGASSRLTTLLPREAPNRAGPVSVQLDAMLEKAGAPSRTTITVLMEAVGFILLIACVNVAGLLLARGATREAELAVRASIGAGRFRLMRQLLTESLVLAGAGGLAGILLAWLALDVLVANIPMSLPPDARPTIGGPVLAASVAFTALTGLSFGLLPALRLSRARLGAALAGSSRRAGAPLSRRGGQFLIGGEVALALVLLAGAGLMIRSFGQLVAIDLGFEPTSIVSMQVTPLGAVSHEQFYASLVDAIRRLPLVAAAGAIDHVPLSGSTTTTNARAGQSESITVGVARVLPGAFEALGLDLREGRTLTTADVSGDRPFAWINEEAQRRFFAGRPAAGRTIEVLRQQAEVIGVVGDIRPRGPVFPVRPEIYLPFRDGEDTHLRLGLAVVIRPQAGASAPGDRLRQAAKAVGPRVVIDNIRTGDELFGDLVSTPRKRTVLMSLLGAIGLGLTLVGISGMTAYAVARRAQEIGVRMAFGARQRDVVALMVRDAVVPIVAGALAGLGLALVATRAIASFLFRTTPTDPATFAAVGVVLVAAGCVAAWLPARRAARVHPVVALRAD